MSFGRSSSSEEESDRIMGFLVTRRLGRWGWLISCVSLSVSIVLGGAFTDCLERRMSLKVFVGTSVRDTLRSFRTVCPSPSRTIISTSTKGENCFFTGVPWPIRGRG